MVLIIAFVAFSACFALGAFGDDSVKTVERKYYPTGGFSYNGRLNLGYFDGNGAVSFDDGGVYAGEFAEGRPEGEGVFETADTGGFWRFTGVFENGFVQNGKFNLKNGETVAYNRSAVTDSLTGPGWHYIGAFNMEGQHGSGAFTFPDGSVYTGGFLQGLAHGEGAYTDASGGFVYSGGFKEGLFDGRGKYYGEDWFYEGDFKEGLFDGRGKYHSAEGWSYEGEFLNGLFNGEGVITAADASFYGIWEKGVQIKRHE